MEIKNKPSDENDLDYTMKYTAAAMSDLAPKLLHRYRKSIRSLRGGAYRLEDFPLCHREFDQEKWLVKLLGFLCSLLGTRRSYSSTDIRKDTTKNSNFNDLNRSKSEIRLFSRQDYAYKLDSMEDDDIFSSANSSEQCCSTHEEFPLVYDEIWTACKSGQMGYVRCKVLDMFHDLVRFADSHQKYMDVRKDSKDTDDIGAGLTSCGEVDEIFEISDDEGIDGIYAIECKKGLNLADLEQCCGDYITSFKRILKVYKWLQRNNDFCGI